MALRAVSDPGLLSQLNADSAPVASPPPAPGLRPISDPALLSQLSSADPQPSHAAPRSALDDSTPPAGNLVQSQASPQPQKRSALEDFDRAAGNLGQFQDSPRSELAGPVTQPSALQNTAARMQSALEETGAMERMGKEGGLPASTQLSPEATRAIRRLPQTVGDYAGAMIKSTVAGTQRAMADINTRMQLAREQSYLDYASDDPRVQAMQRRGAEQASALAGEAELRAGRADRATRRAQAQGEAAIPEDAGPIEKAFIQGLGSAAVTVPIVTAGAVIPGGQAPALAALGGMTGISRYGELRAAGLSEGAAALSGGYLGALEGLTEAIPLGKLAKKTPFLRKAAEFLVTDILGENINTAAQIVDDYRLQLRDDVTMGDIKEALKETTAATVVGAGAQLSVSGLLGLVLDRANERAKVREPTIEGPTDEEIQAGVELTEIEDASLDDADLERQIGELEKRGDAPPPVQDTAVEPPSGEQLQELDLADLQAARDGDATYGQIGRLVELGYARRVGVDDSVLTQAGRKRLQEIETGEPAADIEATFDAEELERAAEPPRAPAVKILPSGAREGWFVIEVDGQALTEVSSRETADAVAADLVAPQVAKPSQDEVATQTNAPTLEERLQSDEALRYSLQYMADEAGWIEEGGKLLRASNDFNHPEYNIITGRTKWLPRADWWPDRPRGFNEQKTRATVAKALTGEKLSKPERRLIDFMVEVSDQRNRLDEYLPEVDDLPEDSRDSLDAGFESAMVARASDIDADSVERLAIQYEDDQNGFLRAIKRLLDEHDDKAILGGGAQDQRATGQGAPGQGGAAAGVGEPQGRADASAQARLGSRSPSLDLFGEDTRTRQAIADETRRRDERRSPNKDVPLETGRPDDLFSQSRQQVDFTDQLAQARDQTNTEPSDGQKSAGNYAKGRLNFGGLRIAIENPAGSTRSGEDASSKPWSQRMAHDYGYVERSEGYDGDEVDVFLTGQADTGKAFVIEQVNKDGSLDEHKVVLGAESTEEAKRVYQANYPRGWTGMGPVTELTTDEFGRRARAGAFKKGRSARYVQRVANTVTVREDQATYEGRALQTPVLRAAREDTDAGRRSPGRGRRTVGGDIQPAAPVQLDIFTAAGQSASAQKAARLLSRTRNVETGRFRTSLERIDTWQDAAHLIAPLRKSPQEQMLVVVLDAQNRPLAVLRHTIGLADQSAVDPLLLTGAITRMSGVKRVYFAHNHPSGNLEPSNADRRITQTLARNLEDTGIEPMGMLIVAPGSTNATFFAPGQDESIEPIRKASRRGRAVPQLERRFRRIPLSSEMRYITAPRVAQQVVKQIDEPAGILLLDNRHGVRGVLPMSDAEMQRLRTGRSDSGAGRILAIMEEAGANHAIAFGQSDGATNVARMLNSMNMGSVALDALVREGDDWKSLAEAGDSLSGLYFSEAPFSRAEPPAVFRPDPKERESFRAQLRKAMASLRTSVPPITLGRTSAVLRALGAKDAPVTISRDIVRKATNQVRHFVPMEVIEQLPEELADPIAVFDSETEDGALVVLTEHADSKGAPIIVAIDLRSKALGQEITRIASVYGKDNEGKIPVWARAGLGAYRSERASGWRTLGGLLLPSRFARNRRRGQEVLTEADIASMEAPKSETRVRRVASPQPSVALEMHRKRLETHVQQRLKSVNGAPKVRVLRSVLNLPEANKRRYPQQFQNLSTHRARGIEGLFDPATGEVFIFSDVVKTPARAAWVLFHELAGHKGMRAAAAELGISIDALLEKVGKNVTVQKIATELARQRNIWNARRATDEALAELAAATRTGDYSHIEERYKVTVPQEQRNTLRGVIERLIQRIKAAIARRFDVPTSEFTDTQVYDLIADAWQAVQADGARRGSTIAFSEASQVPAFYSALLRAVESGKLKKGSGQQWLATLKNQPGVKIDEIEWTGLDAWLAEQTSPVSLDQVAAFVRANQIQVQEVVKDDAAARYQKWTAPGGESYRELLLTLPTQNKLPTGFSAVEKASGKWEIHGPGPLSENRYGSGETREAAIQSFVGHGHTGAYRSSHWSEPNVLAHVRFDERTDADGKRVLHIAEIQSDWHQEGRKRGYKPPDLLARIEAAEQVIIQRKNELAAIKQEWRESAGTSRFTELEHKNDAAFNSLLEAQKQRDDLKLLSIGQAIPDAPFKTTWPELAFKRALRWAVENNFDRVTWDTGAANAERYDLSRQVDAIRLEGDFDQSIEVSVAQPGQGFGHIASTTKDKLADVVGKEISDKALNEGQREFRGVDLKVGGEGMRAFYDKILPAAVNKLVKKWGGKVSATRIPEQPLARGSDALEVIGVHGGPVMPSAERTVHALDITDAMRDSVMAGQPLFSEAPPDPAQARLDRLKAERDRRQAQRLAAQPGTAYVPMYQGGQVVPLQATAVTIGAGAGARSVPIPDRPIRREHILAQLQRDFDVKVYQGKPFQGRGMLGFFRPKNFEVRIKHKNDLEVTAHEIFHFLDYTHPELRQLYRDPQFKAELTSISYDAKKLDEGFAEFGRLFLTQDAQALAKVPQFYAAFTAKAQQLGIYDRLTKVQDRMHQWYAQGALQRARSKIGIESEPLAQRMSALADVWSDRAMAESVDHLHAAKVIERTLTGTIAADAMQSPYKSLRLLAGARNTIEAFLNFGTVNWTPKGLEFTGKSLKHVFEPVAHVMEDALSYFVGRRAQELMGYGKERLFTPDEIEAMLDAGRNSPAAQEIEQAFNEYQAYTKRLMDFAERSGIVSRETRDVWEAMYQNYVPFYRVSETMGATRMGGPSVSNPFKKLFGGTANLNDIWDNMVMNTATVVHASLRNMAKAQLFNTIEKSPLGQRFAVRIPTATESVQVGMTQVETVLRGLVDEAESRALDPNATAAEKAHYAQVWQALQILTGAQSSSGGSSLDAMQSQATFFVGGQPPSIPDKDSILVKGERVWFQIADPLLWDMLTDINYHKPIGLLEVVFGAFKRTLTRGVTITPEFQLANLIRDTFNAFAMSKGGQIPFVHNTRAMANILMQNQDYQLFLANGGGFGNATPVHEGKRVRLRMRQLIGPGKKINIRAILDTPAKLLDAWDKWGQSFELGTRIAEFKRIRDQGGSLREAAFEGREISSDFAMHGRAGVMRAAMISLPFFNARVQGLYRLERELFEREGRQSWSGERQLRYAMRGLLGITMPALLLYFINKDDEDYKSLPDEIRYNYYPIKLSDSHDFVLIPRPFETGALFATIPEQMWAFAETRNERKLMDAAAFTLISTFAFNPIPQVARPGIESYANRDWRGLPIVPRGLENVEPREQYRWNTPQSLVEIGKRFNVSPIALDHYLRGYFGGVASYLVMAGDSLVTAGEYGDDPTRRLQDYPVVRRFLRESPYGSTSHQREFWDLKREIDRTVNTAKKIRGEYRADDLEDYLGDSEKSVLFGMGRMTTRIGDRVREISAAQVRIRRDASLSGAEKRQQIDELQREMNGLFREVVKALNPEQIEQYRDALEGKQPQASAEQKLEKIGSLIDGKPRRQQVASLRQGGFPAMASLLAGLPSTPDRQAMEFFSAASLEA